MKTNLKAIYDHPGMQTLYEEIKRQDHRTLVLWALQTGQEILDIFTESFPDDPRPKQALDAAEAWSRGEIKMPAAKKAARETHEAAKEAKMSKGSLEISLSKRDAAVAAAHAMGQIIGVVHVGTHSTAYAAYAVQASVLFDQFDNQEATLSRLVERLTQWLTYWETAPKDNRPWATFLH